MEFTCYHDRINIIILNTYKNPEKCTVEDYLKVIATIPPTPLAIPTKCEKVAEKFREMGNVCFANGKYKDAVIEYGNSLRAAAPYSKSSALAYANRSAALYHLEKFEDCIADVERALDLPYPNNLKPKIIARKKSALDILKRRNQNLAKDNEVEAKVDELTLAHGENPKLPGVSVGIELACSYSEGRRLLARKEFQLGDLLFVEEPFFTVPTLETPQTFCHHCIKESFSLIPCDRCCIRMYCSEECKKQAFDNYHRTECPLLEILDSVKFVNMNTMIVILRCLLIFTNQGDNFDEFYKEFEDVDKNKDSEKLIFTEEELVNNKRKVILSLQTKKLEELMPRTSLLEAGYVTILLRNYTSFFKKQSDIPRVANVVVKMYKIFNMNNFPRLYTAEKRIKAYSLYPFTSLAKHICSTNTIAYMDKNERLVLRASESIKPGEQLRINYRNSAFIIDDVLNRPGPTVYSERVCTKCDKRLRFPTNRKSIFKVRGELEYKLSENPNDIETLWEFLKLMYRKDQGYTIQNQLAKIFIVDAYEGCLDEVNFFLQFKLLGIL